jgi:hypothetical protein
MAARPRTTFDKLQKERARQEKQAAKRARRQGTSIDGRPLDPMEPREVDPNDMPALPEQEI